MVLSELTKAAVEDSSDIRRLPLAGIGVDAVNLEQSVELAMDWVRRRERKYICFCNIRSIARSDRDPVIRRVFAKAGLAAPDGMPLVWILKSKGFISAGRVYGPDFLLACCETSAREHHRHAFFGGAPGVADRLAFSLRGRFPGMEVAGTWSPPFRELTSFEDAKLIQEINEAAPDIVWVGLGAPRQEIWMARNRPHLQAPVLAGVGYAFEVHAGLVRQAPPWMQQSGLEWLFRSIQNPRRLWSHIIVDGMVSLSICLRNTSSRK